MMVGELDALRTAKLRLDQHGPQEAWRILTAQVLDEHLEQIPTEPIQGSCPARG